MLFIDRLILALTVVLGLIGTARTLQSVTRRCRFTTISTGRLAGNRAPAPHYFSMSVKEEEADDFNLTPVLKTYANGLRNVVDDKLRYQQLLFLAAKCPEMDASLKLDSNKVPGCLSVVHVHADLDSEGKISYKGDSDSQLTKGLVTLLVKGLSGHTPEEIEAVDPKFIQYAGVAKSLTPGRNNGFLNMLNLMKVKAKQLADGDVDGDANDSPGSIATPTVTASETTQGPVYSSIQTKLSMLKPSLLEVEDESYKHAGHAGIAGVTAGSGSGETHFNVKIVAECFDGLSRVQRHQMVYALLAQEMKNGVHALSINAKTPSEV